MPFHQWMELAAEIKQQILDKCGYRDLHNFLKIGELRPFAEIALGKKRFWKDGSIQTFPEFLEGIVGTRFSTAKDVENFLKRMEGSEENPFPNGVVIFVPPENGSRKGIGKFHEAFGELINRYSTRIKKLVYCMFTYLSNDDHYKKQLLNICKLTNLQSLAVYHGACFDRVIDTECLDSPYNLFRADGYSTAPVLKELIIFPFKEDGRRYPIVPHLINYLVLIPNFVGNLEYLQFPWKCSDNAEDDVPYRFFSFNKNLKRASIPKLKKLKVILSRESFEVFEDFCRPEQCPQLKEISLLMGVTSQGSRLGKAIRFLDGMASTLERVHLDFDIATASEDRFWRVGRFDWNVKYLLLKEASIGLSQFTWESNSDDAWSLIKEKWTQLEVLTLVNNLGEDEDDPRDVVPFQCHWDVLKLWETMPSTLKTVRVPHLDLVLTRRVLM